MKASNKDLVAIRVDSVRIASSQKEAVKKVRVIAAVKGFRIDSVRKDSKGNVIMCLHEEFPV